MICTGFWKYWRTIRPYVFIFVMLQISLWMLVHFTLVIASTNGHHVRAIGGKNKTDDKSTPQNISISQFLDTYEEYCNSSFIPAVDAHYWQLGQHLLPACPCIPDELGKYIIICHADTYPRLTYPWSCYARIYTRTLLVLYKEPFSTITMQLQEKYARVFQWSHDC